MKIIPVTILLLLLSACATPQKQDADSADIDPFDLQDPIKPANKAVFEFNLGADRHVVMPVAKTWHRAPRTLRNGVSNFLSNLGEPANVINGVLQLNPDVAFTSLGRFMLNSTLGVAGFRDFAGNNGIISKGTNFAKTMGRYGVRQGAYIVLPLVGPSTVRDTAGLVVDWFLDPAGWLLTTPLTLAQGTSDAIVAREENSDLIEQLYYKSLDPYTASRAAYLQNQAFDWQ